MLIDNIRHSVCKTNYLDNNRSLSFYKSISDISSNPLGIVIDITSVIPYMKDRTGREFGIDYLDNMNITYIYNDLISLMPPSKMVWIEYGLKEFMPRYMDEFFDLALCRPSELDRVGCLVLYTRLRDKWGCLDIESPFVKTHGEKISVLGSTKEEIVDNTYSVLIMALVFGQKDSFSRFGATCAVGLDNNSELVAPLCCDDTSCTWRDYLDIWADESYENRLEMQGDDEKESQLRTMHAVAQDFTLPVIMSLSLMNVKNIELREHKHDKKLQNARQKKGKLPLVKVHTLEISAPGIKQVGGSSSEKQNSGTMPLHLVRGHLADYREGRGLFGKHKGVFWMPAHMRGSIENGIVKKRYRIKGE